MELPAQFGRYQLLERIAAGGMAEVFLARSFGVEGFEKRLVIKRILPELAQNPRFVQMFVHEAKLSVSLAHPNIVQVFDLGKVGDDPYMAMEYIQGRDLTQVLRVLRRNGERLPIPIAVTIAAAVARGLAYAHARAAPDGRPLHIVHRDVSPHNIMVSYEGDVKLVDFGIARLVGEREGADAKRPGGGKFAYMSPEQAAGKPLDHRSDIFSLGVVLFEMLAGRRLFADGDPDEKLRAVI
ncbi:MAG: serine/threonine-protein kinase, partial [Myxococcota bacterium]